MSDHVIILSSHDCLWTVHRIQSDKIKIKQLYFIIFICFLFTTYMYGKPNAYCYKDLNIYQCYHCYQ